MSRSNDNIKSRTSDAAVLDDNPKKQKSKALKVFTIIGVTIITILVITAITLVLLIIKGRNEALKGNNNIKVDVPKTFKTETGADSIGGEYVYYNGKKYLYNSKMTTIVFAGIDTTTDEHDTEVFGTAGLADCIFVMALDTESGDYKLMAVSRDSMVDIDYMDNDGLFYGTKYTQICRAHGYGEGKEISAENLNRAISRLFFGIPVNSYMNFDLDVIPILNDKVGGVNVTVNEDLSKFDPELKEGANVTLNGKQAELFVRRRDIYGDENQNNLRMERQKIFLTSFIKQTLKLTKEDFSTPLDMYNSCSDHMVTDIDASRIAYFTSIFLKSGFDSEKNMLKVPGETKMGEVYAEYYVDTDEFFKIILDTYYTEAE